MEIRDVTVPVYAWYGDKEVKLQFPEEWKVFVCKMAGHDAPSLSREEIWEKIAHPIGAKPLQMQARGKKECVVIVDDLSRPTRVRQVLPPVLNEISKGGISDDHIRFVMATGSHGPRTLQDFVKKLGDEIPERFEIFNHNVYENNVYLGETSRGTPIWVNREILECDLKVAIGSIIPHLSFGYGGGAKIICPGVVSIDTIDHNHNIEDGHGVGRTEGNSRRLNAEEIAKMVGLDLIVNVIMNAKRDCADLVCGDFVAAHREGVKIAKKHYATQIVQDVDIAVGNGYPIENQAYKGLGICGESVKVGGDIVILAYTPEGCRIHYYRGKFGKNYGGKGWTPEVYIKKTSKMGRLIVVTPHIHLTDKFYYREDSVWVKSWDEALEKLEAKNRGDVKVAIYPCATIQISEAVASLP